MIAGFTPIFRGYPMCADPVSPAEPSNKLVILGDGCAALSLAQHADQLSEYQITVVRPEGAPPERDHIWGLWKIPGADHTAGLERASWHRWSIVTNRGEAILQSDVRPYMALNRLSWTGACRDIAARAGVAITSTMPDRESGYWLDTRPAAVPEGMMLQHFIGQEIVCDDAVFDPGTAILMDFRTDQSQGMHFIYLLPFSEREALVESTLFSPTRCGDDFYRTAIETYLRNIIGVSHYQVSREEKGTIPLGILPRRDPSITGLGGNGGAIRPSSGYAFVFIQKQVKALVASLRQGRVEVTVPHRAVDLWMDAVLLSVLRHWPEQAPQLFLAMARALSGEEFARFLSGEASWRLRAKVVMAMPKLPFIRGLLRLMVRSHAAKPAEVM